MDTNTPKDPDRTPSRLAALFGVALLGLLIGALFTPIVVGAGTTTVNAWIKNFPKMPWKVAVVSEPARTPINARAYWNMPAADGTDQVSIYDVPAGKYLHVTGLSLYGFTSSTDGAIVAAYVANNGETFIVPFESLRSGTWGAPQNLRAWQAYEHTEWVVPSGTAMYIRVYRAEPTDSVCNGNVYMTGYLTSAP